MVVEPFSEQTPSSRGLVLLTVQQDADVAGSWRAALIEAGVDVELHIEDGASFSATSSLYPTHGTSTPWVYALFVPRADRERAAGALIDHGWDGRSGTMAGRWRVDPAFALRGALVSILAGAAVVVALLLLRGG